MDVFAPLTYWVIQACFVIFTKKEKKGALKIVRIQKTYKDNKINVLN